MTRAIDRWFLRYRRTGDVRLLGKVFDRTAPELWRLAAHLCADRHDAEDAVQTAFLAAIENRDAWDEERPLVPWLLGVLANRVREQRRREGRVVDAARAGAPTAVPDPSVVAAQRELDARLASSLVALGEPYTTTLHRHLFEGLAAVDLARELGVPAGTVRMRLHRGLERLRELLPAGLGTAGMASVAAPLLLTDAAKAAMREQVLAKAVAVGGTARAGSLVALPWLLAALLPIVLVGAAWALVPSAVVPSTPVVASVGSPSIAPELGSVAAAPPPGASVDSRTLPVERRRVTPSATGSTVPGTLRVTVVHGATKEPLAGMRVTASRDDDPTGTAGDDPQTRSETTSVPVVESQSEQAGTAAAKRVSHKRDRAPTFASGRTDADGRVDLMIAAGPVRVTASIGTNVSSRVEVVGGGVTEHTHAVPVLFTAEVQVVAADGAPCEGATLMGKGVSASEFEPMGVTDREGRWRSSRLDPQLQVRAVRDGNAASNVEMLTIGREQARLVLGGPAPRLHGVVRDPAGAVLPNARLVLWQDGATFDPLELRADIAGAFECSWLAPGRYRWLAGDAERKLAPGLGQLDVAFGMQAVDLPTSRGARIVVRAQRPDNSAILGIGVSAEAKRSDLPDAAKPWRVRHTILNAYEGEVSGLLAGPVCVTANWGGKEYSETVEVADGGVRAVTFVCVEGETLAIEVVDEHDLAFAGIGVALRVEGGQNIQTTDARGRVEFAGVAAGQHEVAIGPAGMKGMAWVRHPVNTGDGQRLVVPRSLGSARVRGRLTGDGLDGEVWVLCSRDGLGASMTERSSGTFDAASGAFVVENLPAGSFHLQVLSPARMQVLAMRTVEVPAGGDVDLGTIACGHGELVVRLHGDGELRNLRAGAGMTSQFGLMPTTSDGVMKQPLPEGTWQVLAWAENAQPAIVSAAIKIGASTELDVTLVPGTPTTFLMVLDPMLEFTLADGRQFGCMVAQTKSLTLGLPPGRHQVVNRDLNGEWVATTFDVGAEPGTVDLTKLPTTR
jgi:RNA polymerase sigma-70 factor (ECF subfamily)